MDELKKFVARWSRRKRASDLKSDLREGAASLATAVPNSDSGDEAAASQDGAAPTFDLAALPSLEAITAATDIRAFLQSAVPIELTRAALRRAWVSDPRIRDFIGIAENQWDFTNPTTIPGFGPLLQAADETGRVAQAAGTFDRSLGRLPASRPLSPNSVENALPVRCEAIGEAVSKGQGTSVRPTPDEQVSASAPADGRGGKAETPNLSQESVDAGSSRRAHGGALPR
jgi:Protein of unknown function (DUF3306)